MALSSAHGGSPPGRSNRTRDRASAPGAAERTVNASRLPKLSSGVPSSTVASAVAVQRHVRRVAVDRRPDGPRVGGRARVDVVGGVGGAHLEGVLTRREVAVDGRVGALQPRARGRGCRCGTRTRRTRRAWRCRWPRTRRSAAVLVLGSAGFSTMRVLGGIDVGEPAELVHERGRVDVPCAVDRAGLEGPEAVLDERDLPRLAAARRTGTRAAGAGSGPGARGARSGRSRGGGTRSAGPRGPSRRRCR